MKNILIGLLTGFIFALGLGLAGMTLPDKVIHFLDVFGKWDPSLMFVMIGAIAVYSTAFHLITRRMKAPVFAAKFDLPTKKHIDRPLLVGSALFGIGWGLGGMCPAPAVTSVATGNASIMLFVIFMVLGMYIYQLVAPKITA